MSFYMMTASISQIFGKQVNIEAMFGANGSRGPVPEELTEQRIDFLKREYGDKANALIEVVKEHG